MKIACSSLIAAAALAAAAAFPGAAAAMGCNGIVNPLVAGCSRADNNDGAGFPYAKLQRVTIPAGQVRIEMKQGTPMVQYQGKWMPVISASGNNIVAAN